MRRASWVECRVQPRCDGNGSCAAPVGRTCTMHTQAERQHGPGSSGVPAPRAAGSSRVCAGLRACRGRRCAGRMVHGTGAFHQVLCACGELLMQPRPSAHGMCPCQLSAAPRFLPSATQRRISGRGGCTRAPAAGHCGSAPTAPGDEDRHICSAARVRAAGGLLRAAWAWSSARGGSVHDAPQRARVSVSRDRNPRL